MTKRLTADKAFLARHLPDLCLLVFVLVETLGVFLGGSWAALGLSCGGLMFLAIWRIEGKPPAPRTNIALLAFTFLITVALINLQSVQPHISWLMFERLTNIMLLLMLLSSPKIQAYAVTRTKPERLFEILPFFMIVGALAVSLEMALDGPLLHIAHPLQRLTAYNRGISYITIFAFPVMAGLWVSKERKYTVPFALILLLPLLLTESRAAKMAFAIAVPTMLIAAYWPRLVRGLLAALAVVLPVWPFVIQKIMAKNPDLGAQMFTSWRHRLEIWDFLSYRIEERPLLGSGVATAKFLSCESPNYSHYLFIPPCPPHPHNFIIQLWVELGIPGLILGIAFMLLTLHWIGRLDRQLAPFATGAWIGSLLISLVAYDFWTDSLFSMFALTAFAFVLLDRQLKGTAGKI
jgi:O-antigen ligase